MKKLVDILQRLVGNGNTVVVIEHNLDIVKTANKSLCGMKDLNLTKLKKLKKFKKY